MKGDVRFNINSGPESSALFRQTRITELKIGSEKCEEAARTWLASLLYKQILAQGEINAPLLERVLDKPGKGSQRRLQFASGFPIVGDPADPGVCPAAAREKAGLTTQQLLGDAAGRCRTGTLQSNSLCEYYGVSRQKCRCQCPPKMSFRFCLLGF